MDRAVPRREIITVELASVELPEGSVAPCCEVAKTNIAHLQRLRKALEGEDLGGRKIHVIRREFGETVFQIGGPWKGRLLVVSTPSVEHPQFGMTRTIYKPPWSWRQETREWVDIGEGGGYWRYQQEGRGEFKGLDDLFRSPLGVPIEWNKWLCHGRLGRAHGDRAASAVELGLLLEPLTPSLEQVVDGASSQCL